MTPKPATKSAARKPRKKGTAKSGAKAQRTAKRVRARPMVLRERLTWRGVTLALKYEPKSACSSDHGSLELKVVAPKGIPLPITETGYWAYFLPCGEVEEGGGLGQWMASLLDQEAKAPTYQRALDRWRQLDLFADTPS